MKKLSLSHTLLAAGALALAGAAQADAVFYPDGTMVDLGESGAELLAQHDAGRVDTTVLGGPAAVTTTRTTTTTTATVTPVVEYVYVQPSIDWDRDAVVTHMHTHRDAMAHHRHGDRHAAAATFDVPAQAGEASTMTGGAPNAVTSNQAFVVGSAHIPYSAITVGQPYYVMSF